MAMWDMECNDCKNIDTVIFSKTRDGLQEEDIKNYKCKICGGKTTKLYNGKIHLWAYNDDDSRDGIKMYGKGGRGVNKTQVPYHKRKILEAQTGLSYKQKVPLSCNFY